MNKDTFRGLVIGMIVSAVIGGMIFSQVNLSNRMRGLEQFLNNIVARGRQSQPQMPIPETKKRR